MNRHVIGSRELNESDVACVSLRVYAPTVRPAFYFEQFRSQDSTWTVLLLW